jgi:hypothetical protein
MPIRTISNLPNVADYDYRNVNIPIDSDYMQLSMLNTIDGGYNSSKVLFSEIKSTILGEIPYATDVLSGEVRFATDAEFNAGVSETTAVTPSQLSGYGGSEYVKLTGGGLAQSDGSVHTYELSAFTGTGIDTDNITEIHVSTDLYGYEGLASYVTCTYGGEAGVVISYVNNIDNSTNHHITTQNKNITRVPIEVGQTQFTIQNFGYIHSFTLLGVTQRNVS